MGIVYCREIDGLRAIAVGAVVLYHAGVGGAGFVGVDVFFVISGYLITALLLRERDSTGRIDLAAFYARRVRRIFPAGTFVVLASLGTGYLLLGPAQLAHMARSAASALGFGANVFFQFASGGYFDASAEEMPLLHLWSLSVEEQFYFVWPALLIATARWRTVPVLAGVALASFALSEWLMATTPSAAFYQMPARAWELAAGGIVAAMPARALPRWVASAGLLLVLAACVWPVGRFPGVGALPAVLGAAALLWAIHGGATNALLASRPFVGVGLISYSLYLWHWPLLAFYRATTAGEGSMAVRLQLCAAAVLLAAATYRYVEQPFRKLRAPKLPTVAVGAVVSASLAVAAFGLALRADGQVPRVNPLVARANADHLPLTCQGNAMDGPAPKCPRKPTARMGIWGDSMAWAWAPAVLALDKDAAMFTRDACGPFLGYLPPTADNADRKCVEATELAAQGVEGLDTLVLVALWGGADDERLAGPLQRTLDRVAPKVGRVVLIGPTPRLRDQAVKCFEHGAPEACAVPRAEFDASAGPVLAKLSAIAAAYPNVSVVDPVAGFCDSATCPPARDGAPLYWDTHHITATAARSVVLGL